MSFLLLLSVLLEQFWIARFFPMVDAAGSIRPMIVFLDIPLPLPAVHWLPVTVLFSIVYAIVITPGLTRTGRRNLVSKSVWKALTGWWLLLGCIAAGGGVYYLIQEYLPKQVANGIDSFGIRADITLPYPSGELIHLHGSVIELLFALLGLHWMARLTAIPQPAPAIAAMQPAVENPAAVDRRTAMGARAAVAPQTAIGARAVAEAQAIIDSPQPKTPVTTILKTPRREPVLAGEPVSALPQTSASPMQQAPAPSRPQMPAPQTPAPRRSSVVVTPPPSARPIIAPQQPAFPGEPPTCRLTIPPPIAVVMPRRAPGIGKTHPCFVIDGLKPHPTRSS